jgi:transposase
VLLGLAIRLGLLQKLVGAIEEIIFAHFVPDDHILRRVAKAVDFERLERICEQKYCGYQTTIERIRPVKLLKLLLVMFLYPIGSNRELCRRAGPDLAIRWFCGFGLLEKIPDHSTLSRFRSRLGARTFDAIFVDVLHQCVEAGLVKADRLVGDSSKLPARARRYSPRQQAERLARAFLEELFGTAYVEVQQQEDRQRLEVILKKASDLVGYKPRDLAQMVERVLSRTVRPGWQELRKVVEIPLMKASTIKDRLAEVLGKISHTVGDPDARVGRTSRRETFCGYLMAFMIDWASQVVTACCLDGADTYCSRQFDRLYESHKANLASTAVSEIPQEVSLDAGYDEFEIRDLLARDGVKAYISLSQRQNKHGVYSTEMFSLTEDGQLICPAGNPMKQTRNKPRKGGTIKYQGEDCERCMLKPSCTKQAKRTVEIRPEEHRRRQQAREAKDSAEYKKALKRRLIIEAVFGHGKDYHLLRQTLYRGWEAVRIQQLMGATALNIEKLVSAKFALN